MANIYDSKEKIEALPLMSFDKSFARLNGQPLDYSEIHYSLDSAKEYAAGAGAYVGQKIVVIEDGKITHYSIEDTAGTLKELGSKPIGDGDTISVAEDGTISLADIPEDAATKTYNAVLVNGKLTWQTPSATTVEGLDTRLQAVEGAVGAPASDNTDATGLYLAIAEGIQEAKDYADENDTDTTYTLDYGSGTNSVPSTEIGSVEKAGYVLHLTDVSVPENATEVIVTYSTDVNNGLEVIGWSNNTIDVVVNELPNPVATFNIQYINNGLPLDGEETGYTTASNAHEKLFNVEGVTIPANATEVSCDYEGLIWNSGETNVRIVGNYNEYITPAITYTAPNKAINLVNNDGEVISSIDVTAFLKDSVLHDVKYDAANNTLTFVWVTDEGLTSNSIVLDDILDPYTAGNGIDITDNKISVKVDSSSEDYVSVGAAGIKASGIGQAISDAVAGETGRATAAEAELLGKIEVLEAIDHTEFATNEALNDLSDTVDGISGNVDTLSGTVDEISETVQGLVDAKVEENKIDVIKVNNEVVDIVDKTVNITVPTKVSDLTDDGNWASQIAQNATDISNLTNTVNNTVKVTADSALEKANENAGEITKLQNADSAHQTEYAALAEIVGGHTTAIAGKAETSTVDNLTSRVATNETAIKTLNETTIPGINTEIGKKANSADVYTKTEIGAIAEGKTLVKMIEDAQTAATYDDTKVKTDIKTNADAIAAIYKVDGENKSGVLADEIARVEGLVSAEKSRAEGIEADHEGRIAEMENFWKAADDPVGTIDKLAEIVQYIADDTTGALDMAADIQANTNAIAAIYTAAEGENEASGVLVDEIARIDAKFVTEKESILALANAYADNAVGTIPTATAEKLGLVKYDDATIKMNENKQLYVAQVSTDLLVQGAEELILNGGTAV